MLFRTRQVMALLVVLLTSSSLSQKDCYISNQCQTYADYASYISTVSAADLNKDLDTRQPKVIQLVKNIPYAMEHPEEVVRLLGEIGGDFFYKYEGIESAFSYALTLENPNLANVMLDYVGNYEGADLDEGRRIVSEKLARQQATEQQEEIAHQEALEREQFVNQEIAKNPNYIFTLAREGSDLDLTVAIAAGANVNLQDAYGQTPLMYAAGSNTAAVVTALLNAGANVNAKSGAGWTALMYAARDNVRDSAAVAQALISNGADVGMVNAEGQSSLDLATASNKTSLMAVVEEEILRVKREEIAERPPLKESSSYGVMDGCWVTPILGGIEEPVRGTRLIIRDFNHYAGFSDQEEFWIEGTQQHAMGEQWITTGLFRGKRTGQRAVIEVTWDSPLLPIDQMLLSVSDDKTQLRIYFYNDQDELRDINLEKC